MVKRRGTQRRRSRSEWSELVQEWLRSGQSAEEFGAARGVPPARLPWWRWRLGLGGASAPGVELVKVEVTREPSSGTGWELRTTGGDVLRVEGAMDAACLRELLAALGVRAR